MAFCRKKSSNTPMMFLACHHRVSLLVHIVPIASHGKHSLAVTNRYLSFGEECKPASCQSISVKILYRNNIDLDQKSGVRGKHLYKRHPFYLGIASFGGLGGVGSEGCKGLPYGLGQTFLWTFSKLSESKNAFQDGLWGKKVPLSAPKCPNDRGAMVKSNLRNAQKAGATFMMLAPQLLTVVVYSYKQG